MVEYSGVFSVSFKAFSADLSSSYAFGILCWLVELRDHRVTSGV